MTKEGFTQLALEVQTKQALQIGEYDATKLSLVRGKQSMQECAGFLPRDHWINFLAC